MARHPRSGAALVSLAVAIVGGAYVSHPTATRQVAPIDPGVFRELSWRPLGPTGAGRVTAAAGVPSRPHVFYVGVDGGGLWQTIDYGQSWRPIFEQPTGAVAAIAVAGSRPDTIYIGTGADGRSGQAMPGDGLFGSTDAGATWTRLGFGAPGVITDVVVDPRTPDTLIVAVVETAVEPDAAAGVFRSIDGGRTFAHVLTTDARAGQLALAIHPAAADVVYALADEGFFRSTDGGGTWQPLATTLPATGSGLTDRIGIAVSPARPDRLIVSIGTAESLEIHRSDDRGATWSRAYRAPSPAARNARVGLAIHPGNADAVFHVDGIVRRSDDGGQTWARWRPAARDDLDLAWIHPSNADLMLIGGRAGAAITVNGGQTWSAPDAQSSVDMMALAVDASFPYRVCGPRRYGPAVCVPIYEEAGAFGRALELPTLSGSAGVVAPDPGNADVLYLRDADGLTRYDSRTGQMTPVAPSADAAGSSARAPVTFGPDGKTLYFADRTLWRSSNGAVDWTAIGPEPIAPTSAERDALVITAVEVSALAPRIIWLGASDGRVHVTRDAAATWTTVTLPDLPAGAGVASLEASHFDTNSVYVVAEAAGPLVWRTRDAGVTWAPITRGLPDARVHVVREDVYRRGLLLAGTDRGVFLSFDDGEVWQGLPLNLPATPVRDLLIEEADVVAATGGRGIWVLDDISAMRQVTADVLRAPAFIFRPATAWRLRAGAAASGGPPIPPGSDRPASRGANEATFHYLLGPEAPAVVTLEVIATTSGELLRRFSSEAPAGGPDWIDPAPGLHRRTWDLRYSAVPPAVAGTPAVPGLRVPAGAYQVRLTTDGRPLRQAISIRPDPRVRTANSDLAAHFALAKAIDDRRRELAAARAAGEASSPAAIATAATLDALARTLDRVDGRPSAAIEAAAAAALQ